MGLGRETESGVNIFMVVEGEEWGGCCFWLGRLERVDKQGSGLFVCHGGGGGCVFCVGGEGERERALTRRL